MWAFLVRASVVLGIATMAKQIFDMLLGSSQVNKNQIYSVEGVAELLKVDPEGVLKLIQEKKLQARMVGDKYCISGKNIIDFIERPSK